MTLRTYDLSQVSLKDFGQMPKGEFMSNTHTYYGNGVFGIYKIQEFEKILQVRVTFKPDDGQKEPDFTELEPLKKDKLFKGKFKDNQVY